MYAAAAPVDRRPQWVSCASSFPLSGAGLTEKVSERASPRGGRKADGTASLTTANLAVHQTMRGAYSARRPGDVGGAP